MVEKWGSHTAYSTGCKSVQIPEFKPKEMKTSKFVLCHRRQSESPKPGGFPFLAGSRGVHVFHDMKREDAVKISILIQTISNVS